MDATQQMALILKAQVEGTQEVKKLKDAITDLQGARPAVDSLTQGTNLFKGALKELAPYVAGFIGVSKAFDFAKESLNAFADSQTHLAQLSAVLQSTGGAAGMTKDALVDLSKEMQNNTKYSDEATLGAESMLLTFTNIHSNVFPATTKAVLDMSTAMGQDLTSTAIQVGKALNDPITGITALHRVGVTFSDAQKKVIEKLVETGQVAKAQQVILDELSKEFGGSAQAQMGTYAGQVEHLKNVFNDFQEKIGEVGAQLLSGVIQKLGGFVEQMNTAFDKLKEYWNSNTNGIRDKVIGVFTEIKTTIIPFFNSFIAAAKPFIDAMINLASEILPTLWGAFKIGLDALKSILDFYTAHADMINSTLVPALKILLELWIAFTVTQRIFTWGTAVVTALQGFYAALIAASEGAGIATGAVVMLETAIAPLVALAVVISFTAVGIFEILSSVSKLKGEIDALADAENKAGIAQVNILQSTRNKLTDAQKSGNEQDIKLAQLRKERAELIVRDQEANLTQAQRDGLSKRLQDNKNAVDEQMKVMGKIKPAVDPLIPKIVPPKKPAPYSTSGGGGAKKATDDLKSKLKEAATAYENFSHDSAKALADLDEKHNKYVTDNTAKLKELQDQYDETSRKGALDLAKLADDNRRSLADIDKSIQKTQDSMAKLNKEFAKGQNDDQMSVAEQVIATQQEIADLKVKITQAGSERERMELQKKIDADQDALNKTADFQGTITAQLAEAKRRAGLSELERAVEDYKVKRAIAVEQFNEQMAQLQEEVQAQQAKRSQEVLDYQAKKSEMQLELAQKLDKLTKEKTALQLEMAAEQKTYDEAHAIITKSIADANAERQRIQTATHKLTVTQVQAEIDLFQKLAQAIRDAASAKTASSFGVSLSGARADGGPVGGGKNYLVGERGPEIFTPGGSGFITPFTGGSGGGVVINISGNTFLDEDAAEDFGDMLLNKFKYKNKI